MNCGHYKVVCPECDTVIRQCRCMSPNKAIQYERCSRCLKNDEGKAERVGEEIELRRKNVLGMDSSGDDTGGRRRSRSNVEKSDHA